MSEANVGRVVRTLSESPPNPTLFVHSYISFFVTDETVLSKI